MHAVIGFLMQDMEMVVPDPSRVYSNSGLVESKSVGTFSPLQKQDSHRGLFVDRGVGSPRLVKSASASAFTSDLRLDTEAKVGTCPKDVYAILFWSVKELLSCF